MRNAKTATLPHCPGETQTCPLNAIMATIPKFVGLKRCFPLKRMTNLLAMVMTAVAIASQTSFVRSSRHNDRPEMSALRTSNAGSFHTRVHTYCVSSADVSSTAARAGAISKSSSSMP